MATRHYGKALWFIGSLNTMLLSIPLPFLLLHFFPEAEGFLLFMESIGIAIPVLVIKMLAEKVVRKPLRDLSAVFVAVAFVLLSLGPVMKTAYSLVLVFYLVLALFAPRPEGRILLSKPQPWQAVIFVLTYALGSGNGVESIRSASAVLFVLFLLLYLLDRNMTMVERKVSGGDAVSSSAILRVNNRMMVAFSILFLLFSIAVPFLLSSVERIEESPVSYVFGEEAESEMEKEKAELLLPRDIALSPQGKAIDGRLFSVFPVVLVFVVSLGAVAFLLYAVFSVIFSFRNGGVLQKEEKAEETVLESVPEEKKGKKEERPGYFSPEGRIRRLYRRTILNGYLGKVDDSLTPKELEEKARIEDVILHEAYEKARYSEKGIDAEDLEKVRKRKSSK